MVSIDLEQTGRHIRALMAEKGWSIKKFCDTTGMDYKLVGNWCRGRYLPRAEHLLELSDWLGVPIEEILVFERR